VKSRTKVKLADDDIRRITNHAFGEVPLLACHELTDGWFNTAYNIKLGSSPGRIVLKVGPPEGADILTYEKNLLLAEVETMKLAADNAQIPVPHIFFDDFSRRYLPYDYYFMEFVPGVTWDKIRESLSIEQNETVEWQLGRITAQINTIENDTFGYYASGPRFDNWPDAFRWMCGLLFADAGRYRIELPLSEQEFFEKFEEHRAIFDEVTAPRLVHWDLWAGNIFVSFEGDRPTIEGIVDFERALWGDPLMESYLGRLDGLGAYFEGYGLDLLATPAQRLRRVFYNIYLDLIMIIEDGPRQYDDKGSIAWAKARLQRDIGLLRLDESPLTSLD
jgi:aminoglycoside phosphotransferase (APT) family kinase protein